MKKKIDAKTFELVKIMTAGGANLATIAEHLGISTNSVGRCRRCETFDDYCALCLKESADAIARKARKRAAAQAAPAPAPAPVQAPAETPAPAPTRMVPVRVDAHFNDTAILSMLREQNELLKLISAKLVFIVEQLV